MSDDVLAFDQRKISRTDSNSLLRMYDRALAIFTESVFQQERAKADKAIQRIAKELQKRQIAL